MPIDKVGFLGEEIKKYRQEIFNKYGDRFNYYKKLNQFLNELKFKLTPPKDDVQRMVIVTLFIKALETFQSVYILASYGLTADGEILNRTLFETIAAMLYTSKSEDNLKRYLAKDLYEKLKLINIYKKNPEQYFNGKVTGEELNKAERAHKADLKELGNPKPITIEAMIRETEIAVLYDSFYRSASGPVHSAPRSLEKYISDQKDKVVVKWGPRDVEIDVLLSAAVEFSLMGCKCLSDIFGNPKEQEIIVLNNEKNSIWLKENQG